MFCTQCGQQMADNTKFCPECGRPVSGEQVAISQAVPASNAKPKIETIQDLTKIKLSSIPSILLRLVLYTILGIIFLRLIGLGLLMFVNKMEFG
jgi:uncharacterized membrane protein YvbJ